MMTDGSKRYLEYQELQHRYYAAMGRWGARTLDDFHLSAVALADQSIIDAVKAQTEWQAACAAGWIALLGVTSPAQKAAFMYAPDDSEFAVRVAEETESMLRMLALEELLARERAIPDVHLRPV